MRRPKEIYFDLDFKERRSVEAQKARKEWNNYQKTNKGFCLWNDMDIASWRKFKERKKKTTDSAVEKEK